MNAEELLHRKMDRKEFLRHIGYGTLLVFGFGSALKTLASLSSNGAQTTSLQSAQSSSAGYNSGAYGG